MAPVVIVAEHPSMPERTTSPLFIAVNSGCNMRCSYCTEFGENRDTVFGKLPAAEILRLCGVAYAANFRTFRATGGEPTLRGDLADILLGIQALGDDVSIALTTNGARLAELLPTLRQLDRPRVFVSVDAVEPTTAGSFTIEKILTPELDKTIADATEVADVRVNFVLSASTRDQLWPLVEHFAEVGVDVKIFELLHRDYFYAGERTPDAVFADEFIPVTGLVAELREALGEPTPYGGTGGKGIPMSSFGYRGIKVVYFDSGAGSHYHDACSSCPRYPCQEGMYAAVLSATGLLHPAGCTNQQFHTHLAGASEEAALAAFAGLRDAIDASAFAAVAPKVITEWRGERRVPVSIRVR